MSEKKKYSKRHCRFCEIKADYVDYKDVYAIKHSVSERGKIMPRRLTGNCLKHQGMVELAVKRARHIGLIPYIVDRKGVAEFN